MSSSLRTDGLATLAERVDLHTEAPPIDPQSIADLRGLEEDNGEGVLPRLIQMFLEDGPRALADLRVAHAAGDAPAVAGIAHTVKGSAGYFGAHGFQELCGAMEQAGRGDNLAPVAELLAAANRELQRVMVALETQLMAEAS